MERKIMVCMMVVTFMLSGCGQNADGSEPGREPQSVQTDSSQTDKSESAENSENTESNGNTQDNAATESKALVAYFAYSENVGDTSSMSVDAIASASLNRDTKNTEGNLQVMAQAITEKTGADTFHIIMTEPYDPDYSTMLPRAIQEMEDEDWPALESKIENLDDYISTAFPKFLKSNGLRPIRFHDTRHSCASLLLRSGVSMKEIQAWLGHSDYSTTANLYAHLDLENAMLQSADRLSSGLFGRTDKPQSSSVQAGAEEAADNNQGNVQKRLPVAT